MPATYVQSVSATNFAATSVELVFVSNNTAGDLLVVGAVVATGITVTGITDTRSNTWVKIDSVDSGSVNVELWYVKNCAAGANTVTVSYSGAGGSIAAAAAEYSSIDTASPLDQKAKASGSGTAADSGATPATTRSNELIVAVVGSSAAVTFTAGASFTEREDTNNVESVTIEDRVVTSTGTYSGTATLSASNPWGAIVATFLEAYTKGGGIGLMGMM